MTQQRINSNIRRKQRSVSHLVLNCIEDKFHVIVLQSPTLNSTKFPRYLILIHLLSCVSSKMSRSTFNSNHFHYITLITCEMCAAINYGKTEIDFKLLHYQHNRSRRHSNPLEGSYCYAFLEITHFT